jgi:hypothetical protein
VESGAAVLASCGELLEIYWGLHGGFFRVDEIDTCMRHAGWRSEVGIAMKMGFLVASCAVSIWSVCICAYCVSDWPLTLI